MKYTETIIEYLKAEMKERNLTQSKMAIELHMSLPALNKRLNGNATVDFETIMCMVEYMGINIDKVFHKNQSKKSIIKIEIETEGNCKVSSIKLED